MRKKQLSICLIIFMMMGVMGCKREDTKQSIPELIAPVEIEFASYQVMKKDVSQRKIHKLTVVPSVMASNFETDGVFDEYNVIIGSKVKKGDRIATLQTEQFQEEMNSQIERFMELSEQIADEEEAFTKEINQKRQEIHEMQVGGDAQVAIELAHVDLEIMETKYNQSKALRNEELDKISNMIDEKEEKIRKSIICAQKDGVVVGLRTIEQGEYIEQFIEVCVIADETTIFCEIDEGVLKEVNSSERFYGLIDNQEVELEYVTRSEQTNKLQFKVVDETLIADGKIPFDAHGYFVMITQSVLDTVALPESMLYNDKQNYYVYVIEGENRIKRDVEIGIRGDNYVEIKAGLKEGEFVYVQQ